jgi:subtilisin family serine protease
MNRPAVVASVILLLARGAAAAQPLRTPAHLDAVPGVVLVAEGLAAPLAIGPGGRLAPGDPALAAVLTRHGLDSGEVLGVPPRGSETRFLRLRSARADFDPRAAAADLRATGAFRAACPDYKFRPLDTLPNDTYLAFQWYVDSGSGVDIRLPLAWDTQKGNPSVVIAILDTGVDTGHPDLASKIWHNPGEIPGNGIDDDGNGYVDDVQGWDFGDGDNDPNPEPIFEQVLGYDVDIAFHGTFCAGIAGAATNNVEGIAGAGWNCRIMDLKASDAAGAFTTAALTGGIQYAAANGAQVLSMSFGGPGDPGVPEFFQALIDVATAAGVVCVAAAGNDGTNALSYPAACRDVISVAATDETGARASFSNWGPTVDVAAPGSSMWSTICRNYVVDDQSQLFYEFLWNWDGTNPYMYGDGTSFACPLTAGVCGLIRSFLPGLTPQQVATELIATGDPVAFDEPIGPRVDAANAVSPSLLAVANETRPTRLAIEDISPDPVRAATTLRLALPDAGRARLALYDCAGRRVRLLVDEDLSAGRHAVSWDGAGAQGARLPGGVYFARLESGRSVASRKLVLLGR